MPAASYRERSIFVDLTEALGRISSDRDEAGNEFKRAAREAAVHPRGRPRGDPQPRQIPDWVWWDAEICGGEDTIIAPGDRRETVDGILLWRDVEVPRVEVDRLWGEPIGISGKPGFKGARKRPGPAAMVVGPATRRMVEAVDAGRFTVKELADMPPDALVAEFSVARTSAGKARAAAMSEIRARRTLTEP